MADKKISALTSASTPLAGTEVLPIVQSSSTVKVSVANLTAGRSVSTGALTSDSITLQTDVSGLMTLGRFSAGYPWVLIRPNSTATGIEIRDFAGTAQLVITQATGNVTVSQGNLVVGTAGKGIDFSANTHAAGMTSQLLDWYEEGTFTATLTGSTTGPTTPVTTTGYYTRVGDLVTVFMAFRNVDTTGVSGNVQITGLPFTSNAASYAVGQAWGDRMTTGSYVLDIGPSSTTANVLLSTGASAAWASSGVTYHGYQVTYKV